MTDATLLPVATKAQALALEVLENAARADPLGASLLYRTLFRRAVEIGAIDEEGRRLVRVDS